MTSKANGMTGDLLSKATGQWDKLEGIFEERVSKALKKIGIPTSKDLEALSKKIDALSAKKPASKTALKAAPKVAVPAKKVATAKRKAAK